MAARRADQSALAALREAVGEATTISSSHLSLSTFSPPSLISSSIPHFGPQLSFDLSLLF